MYEMDMIPVWEREADRVNDNWITMKYSGEKITN